MGREVQVEEHHEGDGDFEGSDEGELEVEEGEHGEGGQDLEEVEPEGAAVDAQVDQHVLSRLLLHRFYVELSIIIGCLRVIIFDVRTPI
jgi:hypothetical protein